MKSKIILSGAAFLLLILIGCEKQTEKENTGSDENPVKLTKTDYLGCFNEDYTKDYPVSDTMFYSLEGETLLLNVVMNQNCGACLADSVVMRKDTAAIYIQNNSSAIANCICDFRFQYHFQDFGKQFYFEVYYSPCDNPDFTLWGELAYP
ncbi:MAG: hypothetical protein ACQESJ_08520 [Bacteroidota bacterium]